MQRHLTLACAQTYCVLKAYRRRRGCMLQELSCFDKHVQYHLCVATLLHREWAACFIFVTQPGNIPSFRLCIYASCSTTTSDVAYNTARSQTTAFPATAATIILFRLRTRSNYYTYALEVESSTEQRPSELLTKKPARAISYSWAL